MLYFSIVQWNEAVHAIVGVPSFFHSNIAVVGIYKIEDVYIGPIEDN